MAVPASKSELLAAIDKTFGKLTEELDRVPSARVTERSMDGHAAGTRMSPFDLVAYLTGWNELVIKWLDGRDAGEEVDFPETGFKWNELGRLAGKFYRDYEDLSYPLLLERLEAARQGIVARIEAREDEALYGRPWYGKWTMGRMIQFNTSSPYENARGRLRAWLKAQAA